MFRQRKFQPLIGGINRTIQISTNEEEDVKKDCYETSVRFPRQEENMKTNRALNPIVFLDVSVGGEAARLTFELRRDIAPRTAENFRSLCVGDRGIRNDGTPLSYQGCLFHRVVKDFAVVGGDIADGTGRLSVYGEPFEDENFTLRHLGPGVLTSCNAGPDSNTSAFMITTVEAPWLDGRCDVFGFLADAESFQALEKIETYGTEEGRPLVEIKVNTCHVLGIPSLD